MKYILLHIFCLLAFQGYFEGKIYANEIYFSGFQWSDTHQSYAIDVDSTLYVARGSSPALITSRLPQLADTTVWSVSLFIDNNVSNANQFRYHLLSSNDGLTDGVYLRVGTNSRNISLMSGSNTILIKGDSLLVKNKFPYYVSAKVIGTVDVLGNWQFDMETAVYVKGEELIKSEEGSATVKASSMPNANFMGLQTLFSSTAIGKVKVTDISMSTYGQFPVKEPDVEPEPEVLPDETLNFSGYDWHNVNQSYNLNADGSIFLQRGTSPAIIYTTDNKLDSIASWHIEASVPEGISNSNQLRFYMLADSVDIQDGIWLRIGTNGRNISLMRDNSVLLLRSDSLLHKGMGPYDVSATVSRLPLPDGNWRFLVNAQVTASDASQVSYADSVDVRAKVMPRANYMAFKTLFSKSNVGQFFIRSLSTTMLPPSAAKPVEIPHVVPGPDEKQDTVIVNPDPVVSELDFCGYTWRGMAYDYSVDSSGVLSLDAQSDTTTSSLFTVVSRPDTIGAWNIDLTINNTVSDQNLMRFFLSSPDSLLRDGIHVAIGRSDKSVSLMLTKNGQHKSLISGVANNMKDAPFHVSVTVRRIINADNTYTYSMYSNVVDGTGRPYYESAECVVDAADVERRPYMGIVTRYSSTRRSNTYYVDKFTPDEHIAYIYIKPVRQNIQRGDVVINELMVRPSDDLGLPPYEYVELYNPTDSMISLTHWSLQVGKAKGSIGECIIQPGDYALLCSKSALYHFSHFGNVVSLSSWPTLTNSKGRVVLYDKNDQVVDFADYDSSMYGDSFKKDGGWSLERIDPYNMSNDYYLWGVSQSSWGGTPLAPNSIAETLIDSKAPSIRSITVSDDGKTLDIVFSEPVDSTSIGSHIKLNGVNYKVRLASVDPVSLSMVSLVLDNPLPPSTLFTLNTLQAQDLAGNALAISDNIRIAIPEHITSGAVIINEIMSNSSPASYDYVEVFNCSQSIFDMRELYFGTVVDGQLKSCNPFTDYSRLLIPGEYYVLCKDSLAHVSHYAPSRPDCVVGNSKFANLPAEGTFALAFSDGSFVDCLSYSSGMHSFLLSDIHNVSLERILTDAATDDKSNWTSASQSSGYATPTSVNSQCRDDRSLPSSQFEMTTRRFTPDADGIDDEMVLATTLSDGVWNATMRIYSSTGILLATPYNNQPMPVTGELRWNGRSDNGSILPPATYIVIVNAFSNDGRTLSYKHTCLLTVTH